MKPAALLVLTLLLTDLLQAQICDFQGRDSIVVKTQGDTLTVWDFAACANCGSRFAMSVSRSADSIMIVQTDTSQLLFLCDCLFDLSASVTGVPNGSYWLVIYRDIPLYHVPHKLITAVQFTMGGSATNSLAWLAKQSACRSQPDAVAQDRRPVPGRFLLSPNYPNPFNPTTTIVYELPVTRFVRLSVVDLLGHEVALVEEGVRAAGRHVVVFDAARLASGAYFARLQAGSHTESRKMLIRK